MVSDAGVSVEKAYDFNWIRDFPFNPGEQAALIELDKTDLRNIFKGSNFRRSVGEVETSSLTLHKVRVEDIPDGGLDLDFSDPKEEWDGYFQEIPTCQFSLREPLEAKISLRVCGKAVLVRGWVRAGVDLQCCRCLEDFSCPLTPQIDVTLFPETDVTPEEETELGREDLDTGFFSEDEIDLSGLIREQIILSIPYKALCHEECKGLCPRCGVNLNDEDCGCERNPQNSAFEVLRSLKLDRE